MRLTTEDRLAITELISRHGHLVDAGELRRSDELFIPDAEFDLTDFGAGIVHGLAALYELSDAMGDGHPVGHHTTNIVVTEQPDGTVGARSKGIGVNADGTSSSVTYVDTLRRGDDGWRIVHRRILAHRRPAAQRVP